MTKCTTENARTRYPLQLIIATAITGSLLAVAGGCFRPSPASPPAASAPTRQTSAVSARQDLARQVLAHPSRPSPTVPPSTPTSEPTAKHRADTHTAERATPPAVLDKEDARPPRRPTSPLTAPDLGAVPTTPPAPSTRHRVEAGDTIFWLAGQYGTSPEAILHANGLDEQGARFLDIGQELVIPLGADGNDGQQAAPIVHQVQAGEVLGIIAERYGTTLEALMAANDLEDAELILAGQELVVPVQSDTELAPPDTSIFPVKPPAQARTAAASDETTPTEMATATAKIGAAQAAELVALEAAMVAAVNVEREARGLPPYRVDDTLAAVARSHAQDMVARDYLGHTSPEGKRLRDRLQDAGLDLDWAGENYYVTTQSAEEAVAHTLSWFMDDPPHRDNILHAYYTRIGVGVAYQSPGWYIFVLDFAGD